MEMLTHKTIHDLLAGARKPVLVSDERTDGDSLGSSLAVADWLARRGVIVPVLVKEAIPAQYKKLPRVEQCTTDVSILKDPAVDLVAIFDCSDRRYIEGLLDGLEKRPTVVNIDHHATNPGYGDVNQVLTGSPATAEVVYRFYRANGLELSRDAATLLLAGICFDTGIFSNGATNAAAFDAASELILAGARVQEIVRMMLSTRSVPVLRLWGTAMERLAEHPVEGFVSTHLTRADVETHGVKDDEIDGLSNFLSLVTESRTLLVLRETKSGGVKGSMRSISQDVSAVAKAFGGGGHLRAAGFTLENCRIAENPAGGACLVEGCPDLYPKVYEILK
jgi:phosphoesterase RecJ-like protein